MRAADRSRIRRRAGSPPLDRPDPVIGGRRDLWIALALLSLTLLLYARVATSGFVNYDDDEYVTANPHVATGLTGANVAWALTSTEHANWHPLTWISHMIDCQIFGLAPAGHHAMSLFIHALNAALLFCALRALTTGTESAPWRCAFVAALFAWHPLHVESVAWVSERKDVLCTFFLLLSLLGYAAYARGSDTSRGRAPGAYFFALTAFALGLASKPMLVTLPFLLLLLDFWPLSRARTRGMVRLVIEKAPFFLLSAGSIAITLVAQKSAGAVAESELLPFSTRLGNAFLSCGSYLFRTIWPARLAVFYPYPAPLPSAAVALSALFLVAVTGLVLATARRHRYLATGWFWYLGTLVPVIGIVQAGSQAMADRYTYVPLIGIFIMIAWGAPALFAREVRGAPGAGPEPGTLASRAIAVGAAISLAACAVLTWNQTAVWAGSRSLWEHAIAVTQGNYVAETNLADLLNSGGKPAEAATHASIAVGIRPEDAEARVNLGLALLAQDRTEEAASQFEEALRHEPGHAAARFNLALVRQKQGRLDEAAAHYAAGLAVAPDNAQAQGNFASVLAASGRAAEAVPHFRAAIALDPDSAGVADAFAWLLATSADPSLRNRQNTDEAIVLATRVRETMGGRDAGSLDTLAAAYAAAGRFEEAAATARTAMAVANAAGRPGQAEKIGSRLALYLAGSPFIEP